MFKVHAFLDNRLVIDTRLPHIRAETLTEMFAESRDACGLGTGAHPPTLHEIRSLSLRLYDAQGVNVQALAGHRSAEMTAIYRDVRGSEWVRVS